MQLHLLKTKTYGNNIFKSVLLFETGMFTPILGKKGLAIGGRCRTFYVNFMTTTCV